MRTMILAALTVLSLAACSGPTINGSSDTAGFLPGEPHVLTPTVTARGQALTKMGQDLQQK